MIKKVTNAEKLKSIIISAVVAVFVWATVVYINPPEMTTSISNLPIKIKGAEVLKERGLTVVDTKSTTGLDVVIKGKRNDLLNLSGGLYVEVDVSSVKKKGEYTFSGNVSLPTSKISVEKVKFKNVPIKIEEITEKEIQIKAEAANVANQKLIKAQPQTDSVIIRGAKSELEAVKYGLITVDASDIRVDTELDLGFNLMDKDNSPVTRNETIEASQTSINVVCEVYEAATLPIHLRLADKTGEKYAIDKKQTSYTPSQITVGVRADKKDEIKGVIAVIPDINGDIEAQFVEEEGMYIPDIVKDIDVKLAVAKRETKEIEVKIKPENIGVGLNAKVSPVKVIVTGVEKYLTPDNISAYVDLSGYGKGTYKVPVILKSEFFDVVGEYEAEVVIS